MMKTFTSHWFSGIWTMTVMALSILVSVYTQDASHVARAGALVTLAGIFITTRQPLSINHTLVERHPLRVNRLPKQLKLGLDG